MPTSTAKQIELFIDQTMDGKFTLDSIDPKDLAKQVRTNSVTSVMSRYFNNTLDPQTVDQVAGRMATVMEEGGYNPDYHDMWVSNVATATSLCKAAASHQQLYSEVGGKLNVPPSLLKSLRAGTLTPQEVANASFCVNNMMHKVLHKSAPAIEEASVWDETQQGNDACKTEITELGNAYKQFVSKYSMPSCKGTNQSTVQPPVTSARSGRQGQMGQRTESQR